MRLYYNLDLGWLIRSPLDNSKVTSLSFIRGDSTSVDLSFVQGGVIVELGSDAAGKFGIKAAGSYDGAFLVSALTWTKAGSGSSAIYSFAPNFNTTELNTALGSGDGSTSNDLVNVSAMAEITWTVGGLTTSTGALTAIVANDVIKDDEGLPTSANPGYFNKDEIVAMLAPAIPAAIAATAAGDYTVAPDAASYSLVQPVTVSDLASGTAKLVLSHTAAKGTIDILLTLPAAAGTIVEIRDGTDTGTLLDTFTSLASAATASLRAVWNGTAWQRLTSKFDTP